MNPVNPQPRKKHPPKPKKPEGDKPRLESITPRATRVGSVLDGNVLNRIGESSSPEMSRSKSQDQTHKTSPNDTRTSTAHLLDQPEPPESTNRKHNDVSIILTPISRSFKEVNPPSDISGSRPLSGGLRSAGRPGTYSVPNIASLPFNNALDPALLSDTQSVSSLDSRIDLFVDNTPQMETSTPFEKFDAILEQMKAFREGAEQQYRTLQKTANDAQKTVTQEKEKRQEAEKISAEIYKELERLKRTANITKFNDDLDALKMEIQVLEERKKTLEARQMGESFQNFDLKTALDSVLDAVRSRILNEDALTESMTQAMSKLLETIEHQKQIAETLKKEIDYLDECRTSKLNAYQNACANLAILQGSISRRKSEIFDSCHVPETIMELASEQPDKPDQPDQPDQSERKSVTKVRGAKSEKIWVDIKRSLSRVKKSVDSVDDQSPRSPTAITASFDSKLDADSSEDILMIEKAQHRFLSNTFNFPRKCYQCHETLWGKEARCYDANLGFSGVELSLLIKTQGDSTLIPKTLMLLIDEVEKRGLNITQTGLETEGIYRKSGSLSQINNQMALLDRGDTKSFFDPDVFVDIFVVTSLIKAFLRNLPSALVIPSLYDPLISLIRSPSSPSRDFEIESLIRSSPPEYYATLGFLIQHLERFQVTKCRVQQHSSINLMTTSNIAVIFATSLIRPLVSSAESEMKDIGARSALVEFMIVNASKIFTATVSPATTMPSLNENEEM